jgi:hypothetical protein
MTRIQELEEQIIILEALLKLREKQTSKYKRLLVLALSTVPRYSKLAEEIAQALQESEEGQA